MKIQEIKKLRQEKQTILFDEVGLFFAFSNEQFTENKTPLKEGDKYVSIGAGGYLPKSNVDTFLSEMTALNKWEKATIKADKAKSYQNISYELANHECFYTGDISDVVYLFKGVYSEKEIRGVYKKEFVKHVDD